VTGSRCNDDGPPNGGKPGGHRGPPPVFQVSGFCQVSLPGSPKVAGLAHVEDYGLGKSVEAAKHVLRWNLVKIPRPDCPLDGSSRVSLPDTLGAAEYKSVVNLLARPLHAVGAPLDDVVGIVGKDLADVMDPPTGLGGVTAFDRRRSV
jgi:hypothetical protein